MNSKKHITPNSPRRGLSPEQKALKARYSALVGKYMIPAFAQTRTGFRVTELLKAMITMGGRRTITNAVVALGQDQQDWKCNYLAFSKGKWDPVELFHGVFQAAVPLLPAEGPIVLAIDDTALPKAGHKISYTRWVHNPLCPKWQHPALQWGLPEFHGVLLIPTREAHRCTAITVAFEPIPEDPEAKRKKAEKKARERAAALAKRQAEQEAAAAASAGAVPTSAIPVPPPKKKGRPSKEEVAKRLAEQGISNEAITEVKAGATGIAVRTIHRVRQWLDEAGMKDRALLVCGDGSYCNGTVMLNLPHDTEFVGRTRPDAKLRALGQKINAGTPSYGDFLPTPEAMAVDPSIPEIIGTFHYGGDVRYLAYKSVGPLYREHSTHKKTLRLLILQPVPYGKGDNRGYNQRAYLLTTDHTQATATLIQAYLDRWQIEVLHRDLKSGVGLGQAQVRNERSVARVHSALTAMYALLLIATLQTQGQLRTNAFGSQPKWRVDRRVWWTSERARHGKPAPRLRPSVSDIASMLRAAMNQNAGRIINLAA